MTTANTTTTSRANPRKHHQTYQQQPSNLPSQRESIIGPVAYLNSQSVFYQSSDHIAVSLTRAERTNLHQSA